MYCLMQRTTHVHNLVNGDLFAVFLQTFSIQHSLVYASVKANANDCTRWWYLFSALIAGSKHWLIVY